MKPEPNIDKGDVAGTGLAGRRGRARSRARHRPRRRPIRGPTRRTNRNPASWSFGDSDFVSNAFSGIPGNRDLALNAMNWLAQQENLISIRPKDPEDRRISLTSGPGQEMIFWLTILHRSRPASRVAGVHTWWRRR